MSASLDDHIRTYDYDGSFRVNYSLLKDSRAKFYQSQLSGACRSCGDWIKPFESLGFMVGSGAGVQLHVTVENSCMCQTCYNRFLHLGEKPRGLAPLVEAYRYSSVVNEVNLVDVIAYKEGE